MVLPNDGFIDTAGSGGSETSSGRSSRRLSGMSPEKALREQSRLGSLRKSYCTQWNFPSSLNCSGCTFYLQAIEGKQPTGKARSETHGRSKKYECQKPWQMVADLEARLLASPDSYKYSTQDAWVECVGKWIKANASCNLSRWKTTAPVSASHSTTKRAIAVLQAEDLTASPETESSVTTTTTTTTTEEDGRKVKKLKEDIEVRTLTVKSQGHAFEIEGVPSSYVVVLKNRYERLRNVSEKVKAMEGSLRGTRFTSKVEPITHAILAVGLSSAPSLPLSQAAHLMPMFVGAFLSNHGLLDNTKIESFSKCFPSAAYFRDLMYRFAAENLLELGEKIKGKFVFLSCDKGSKKGVGHFVKVLSWFGNSSVQKQCLDIDGSEGSTEQCADAINASLKKVGVAKLSGQTTDSGGGGVLDGLAAALSTRGLCNPGYLVASCSLHNLQLTIAKPIKETMGEGGLDKRNVLQLLHSVYDLQDSLSHDVWKLIIKEAQEFLMLYAGEDNQYNGNTNGDISFASKWNKVKAFRRFPTVCNDSSVNKTARKFQAPVLTRWWTVGEAAVIVYDSFLLLLKVTQSIINSSSGKPNKIASGLQPLLLEPEIYSDLTLITCYHIAYVVPHFGWMQAETDLSGVPGFQAHNTLARYFLLQQDLSNMKSTIGTSHPTFRPFQDSLLLLGDQVKQRQVRKVSTFIDLAVESLNKHFKKRWMSKELLPAALLSERPLAAIVASAMLQRDPKDTFDPPEHPSPVHKKSFNLKNFQEFVYNGVTVGETYEPMALHAALQLIDGAVDIRDMSSPTIVHTWMYSTYLPLASHTQFVEAGVKEAKIVSQSDRSEPLRSAYAINRSARVHSVSDKPLRDIPPTERVEALVTSAKVHMEIHRGLRQVDVNTYNNRISAITKAIRGDHYKKERVEQLKQVASNKSNINKKENDRQRKSGVDRTLDQLGFISYGNLLKATHHEPLRQELVHRGVCTIEEANAWNFSESKKKLKAHEVKRLENSADKACAMRGFQPLSTAQFRIG
jgi:hypothetical protein